MTHATALPGRWGLSSIRSWLTRRRIARHFRLLIQAHDDCIAAARRGHHPTRALIAAKRETVHKALAASLIIRDEQRSAMVGGSGQ